MDFVFGGYWDGGEEGPFWFKAGTSLSHPQPGSTEPAPFCGWDPGGVPDSLGEGGRGGLGRLLRLRLPHHKKGAKLQEWSLRPRRGGPAGAGREPRGQDPNSSWRLGAAPGIRGRGGVTDQGSQVVSPTQDLGAPTWDAETRRQGAQRGDHRARSPGFSLRRRPRRGQTDTPQHPHFHRRLLSIAGAQGTRTSPRSVLPGSGLRLSQSLQFPQFLVSP